MSNTKNKALDLEQITENAVGEVGFSEFENTFNLETGQPNSGTRQVIRDRMRNRGVVAHEYHFDIGDDDPSEFRTVDIVQKK